MLTLTNLNLHLFISVKENPEPKFFSYQLSSNTVFRCENNIETVNWWFEEFTGTLPVNMSYKTHPQPDYRMSVVNRHHLPKKTSRLSSRVERRHITINAEKNSAPARIEKLFDQLTPVLLLGLAGLVFYLSLTGTHGLLYLDKLDNQVQRISAENKALEQEISVLKRNIHSINSEGFYLEKKAREELGLSKKGETIYLFN